MNYPDGIKTGTLLRIKKHCLDSTTTKTCGEYAIIAPKLTKSGTSILWDALYPNGQRIIYMPMNWEVINGPE
jgi:hypothetical protein